MGIFLPVALGLLALAIPIIIFYMLRLRRQERAVSSSMLWRRALLDRTANAPWQRLRRNVLLLLQLLLLLLLVLSLAQPFFYTDSPIPGNLVVVLDASASMQATDEEEGASRWVRARAEVSRLIDGLGSDSRMSLIWAGPNPLVAAPPISDRAGLDTALLALVPSSGVGDIEGALTLASGMARQLGGATVVLVSDGAFRAGGELPQMPGSVAVVSVGRSDRNLAIETLSLREASGGPELFVSVYNSGPVTATALLSVLVDGGLREARRISVGPIADAGVTLGGLPLGAQIVEARLLSDMAENDMLAVDNIAWAVRQRPTGRGVLMVTAGNGFLEKALNLLPLARLFKTTPQEYVPSSEYGVTIFDGFVPAQLPPGNLLFFAPPNSSLFPVSGTLQSPVVGQTEVNDPLLRFVDLSGIHIASAARITPPSWARVLVRSTAGDPLLLAGETEGRRMSALAFDLHKTDLPLQVAFPILISNLMEWLQPATSVQASASLRIGAVVNIRAVPEADIIQVVEPAGKETLLQVEGGQALYAGTDLPGVYTVQQRSGGRPLGEEERFAVNLFSRDESSITPRADVGLVGSDQAPGAGARRPVEIWPWLALVSLGLLTLEWWVYNGAGRRRLPWLSLRKRGQASGR